MVGLTCPVTRNKVFGCVGYKGAAKPINKFPELIEESEVPCRACLETAM